MVDPARVPGEHDIFICGDNDSAKTQVREVLQSFGWPPSPIIDLGGIASARGSEGHVLLWLGLWSVVGSGDFNIKVVR
jgi:8-hydroxy-5-deazaflavin:NADPH oxidoreductase